MTNGQPAVRRVQIRENPDNPHPLGRHVEHDPRSRQFAFPITAPLSDRTVYWSMLHIWLDQKKLSGCVGFTGGEMMNCDIWKPIRKRFNRGRAAYNADGINFYKLATQNDEFDGEYPPDDEGSSGLGLAKAFKALGYIDRYTHTFSFSQFRAALQTQPVAIGTVWTESMFSPDKDGIVTVGDLSDRNIAGGHEYLGRGIDYEALGGRGLVWCRNHWRRDWGKDGEFGIPLDDFGRLLDKDGDVTVLHGAGLP